VQGYRSRNIPLDVFVIDMDWHLAFQGRSVRSVRPPQGLERLHVDPYLFPEPKKFLKSLHEQGLKITLNLHPRLEFSHSKKPIR
jgi:alpha-glucosidase (family GH31 glycosyl hydrolase)